MDNQKKRIPIQVYILGAVSFFNDMASEMMGLRSNPEENLLQPGVGEHLGEDSDRVID